MTPEEVLGRVLETGGRVISDPQRPRLLVPPPLESIVAAHRQALRALVLTNKTWRSHTPGSSPFQALVTRIINMSLDEFQREGIPLEVRVPWWPKTLWFVPSGTEVEALVGEGISRGRLWTAAELMDLLTIPVLTAEQMKTIAQAKLEFDGELVEVRSRIDGTQTGNLPNGQFHKRGHRTAPQAES